MRPDHPIQNFLRQHRWRARGTLLVWSATSTLGAVALGGLMCLGWTSERPERHLFAIAVAAGLLSAWFIRMRRLTSQRLARGLDERWVLHARLESALELAGNESSWAAAQRDDALQSLARRTPPGALTWRGGQILLGAVAALLLVEGTALLLRSLHTPSVTTSVTKAGAAPADDVRATIEWKSPDPEIKATAIEEVPLTAIAESNTAFRSFSLEMIVNGDREVTRPLVAAELGDVTKPGTHELGPSLFLDELQVKPFDIVSYRMVGELNTPGPKRTIASLPQIVQIRPPQKDAEAVGKGGSEFPARLFALKAQQIHLIKQNAALNQLAGREHLDPTWAPENARVAEEQHRLAARTADLLTWVKDQHPPPLVSNNLAAAEAEMKSAGKDIAAKENASATKRQNHALALLTELEQFIQQALSGAGPAASDPIRDEQSFKLPSRSETPAGKLEELAARQEKINTEIATATGGSPAPGTDLKNKETAIARAADDLGRNDSFPPSAGKHVVVAATAADEAARQLALGDHLAARVPAAAAQRALELAVEAQEKAGRTAAVAELEQLRRSLNTATRASAGERAERLMAVRRALRAAAVEQQRTGSAEAAQELTQLANLANRPATSGKRTAGAAPPPPNSVEHVRDVARTAAHAQVLLSAHAAAVGRALRLLNRSGENTAASKSPARDRPGVVELASQEAQWLTTDAATIELGQQTAARADALQRGDSSDAAKLRELEDSALKLAVALEHGRADDKAEKIARSFNPADVDPAYREAVEDYFERLSREGRRTPPR
jgi:hypothetical protein